VVVVVVVVVVGIANGFPFVMPSLMVGGPSLAGLLDPTKINHFCTVVSDFNATVANYAQLFGGPLPIGDLSGDYWTYYRGQPTKANCLLTQIPVTTAPGFHWEVLEPANEYPSFWRELLTENGNFFHHFGVLVPEMDSARAKVAAAGYEMVQIGQGPWGCYAYMDGRAQLGAVIELLSIGQLNCSKPQGW